MTTSEQLSTAKAELQTKSARFEELLNKDRDEGGLDQNETAERDTVKTAIKALNIRIDDLSTLEASQAARATGLTFTSPEARRIHVPQPEVPKIEVKALPKGTAFTRYAMAVAAGRGICTMAPDGDGELAAGEDDDAPPASHAHRAPAARALRRPRPPHLRSHRPEFRRRSRPRARLRRRPRVSLRVAR